MMAHVIATRSRCGSGQGEQQTILDVDHFLCPCTMPLCEATSPKSIEPAVRHEVGKCLHEVTMHRSSYLLQENFPISKRPPNGLLNRIVETLLKSHSDSILLVQRCRCFHAKVSFRNTSRRENSLFFGRSHPVKNNGFQPLPSQVGTFLPPYLDAIFWDGTGWSCKRFGAVRRWSSSTSGL